MHRTSSKIEKVPLSANAIVGYGIAIVVSAAALVGRNSYTPEFLDSALGISHRLLKGIYSGYSGAFLVPAGDHDDREIVFFAEPGQSVRLFLDSKSRGAVPAQYRVLIDNQEWKKSPDSDGDDLRLDDVTVTGKLQWDEPPGGRIHRVTFQPLFVDTGSVLVIKCVVLAARD